MGAKRHATTNGSTLSKHGARAICLFGCLLLLSVACSGPDTGDDRDPTPTATATSVPTATATATATPSPTATATLAPTATLTPSPSPTQTAATPTNAGSPSAPSGSPTAVNQELKDRLPKLAEMPGDGYTISAEGTRTAQELANGYADNAAHLQRLTDWGFKAHVYREFAHTPTGADDSLPYDILGTINVYGSPEQAQMALDFLKKLDTSQGQQEVDAPSIGDMAAAFTVNTADGTPTASLYVRVSDSVYVYFAQGGKPLDAVTAISQKVFSR